MRCSRPDLDGQQRRDEYGANMSDVAVGQPAGGAYPVRFQTDYPEKLSRLGTAFRIILAIPLLIMVALLGGGSFVGPGLGVTFGLMGALLFVHWISVLIRGRPVRWLFDAIVAIQRFTLRAESYLLLLTDRYPPFEGDWPVRYEVDYPQRIRRRQLVFWKTVMSIPHFFVLWVLGLIAGLFVFISWFAILITGQYPRGLYNFVSGWLRWSARVNAYLMSLTDDFPPFSLSPEPQLTGPRGYLASAVAGVVLVGAAVGGFAALIAWPPSTENVAVSYQDLLDGEPSSPGRVAGVRLTVVDAQDPYEFSDDIYVPEPGRRFVLFDVQMRSERRVDSDVWDSDWGLKDSRGDSHDPFLATLGGQEPPRRLQPGGLGDVVLVFELPKGVQPRELTYDPSFGFKERLKFVFR